MKKNKYQENNTLYQPQLPFDFRIFYDVDVPEDDISRTVKEVVEGVNFLKYIDFTNRNSYGYNGVNLLEALILAFTLHGYISYRKLADLCKFDIRFKFIMRGEQPSHMAFCRFVNDNLKMSVEDIFYEINKYIEKNDTELNTEILYIDGTKFEANANKFTFVWKKASTKYRERNWEKINRKLYLLNTYLAEEEIPVRFSVLKAPDIHYAVKVVKELDNLLASKNIEKVYGKGHKKHKLQKFYDDFVDLSIDLLRYTVQFDIFGDRNSFSKTDPDATFMHMKYDYYCNTGVFKPGYNVQAGVSDGYIRHIYVSPDCNDINTYIPFMDGYYEKYGKYPVKTPADAGYGSFDNYKYCKEHNIELYLKYNTQLKESEKTTEKNQFKSYKLKVNEAGEIICPAGHAFIKDKVTKDNKGRYEQTRTSYKNEHCEGCPLRDKCTKSKNGRTLIINEELEEFHKEVRENMSTPEGKELMKQRSIQAEGTFGQIKQDNQYVRLRRRGTDSVKLEFLLVAIGHNIRRFHTRKHQHLKKEAGSTVEPEKLS